MVVPASSALAPDGSIADILETPLNNPTTCAFASTDVSTLLFTSAADATQPNQTEGSLYALQTSVRGLLSTPLRL